MMHVITNVATRDDFLLEITFDDGEVRTFDIGPYLKGSLFTPLRDKKLFARVKVSEEMRGLSWPNGADLCADMLYMNSRPQEPFRDKQSIVSESVPLHGT
jgi:hypothetical protein